MMVSVTLRSRVIGIDGEYCFCHLQALCVTISCTVVGRMPIANKLIPVYLSYAAYHAFGHLATLALAVGINTMRTQALSLLSKFILLLF